ncbi:MAG: hypothetical protein K2G25_09360 [Oscillospiraceae bacterium]|nr:hypothetical protein [Oscillospiraceae bacterium]
MKKIKIILVIFHIFSIIICGFAIDTLLERKEWLTTTATITFIGKPQGIVFCEYVDNKGVLHSEDDPTDNPSYCDSRYMGHSGDVSSLIGKTVKIVYHPVSGRIEKDHHLMCYYHIFSYMLSIVLLCVYRKVMLKKIAKNNMRFIRKTKNNFIL